MGNRVTIILDDDVTKILHGLQGRAIPRLERNVSFSDAVNFAVKYAIEKGYNVSTLTKFKEGKR